MLMKNHFLILKLSRFFEERPVWADPSTLNGVKKEEDEVFFEQSPDGQEPANSFHSREIVEDFPEDQPADPCVSFLETL